jgi:hypothetical protein
VIELVLKAGQQLNWEQWGILFAKQGCAKEFELIHQLASLAEGEVSVEQFSGKFQREYFARGKI